MPSWPATLPQQPLYGWSEKRQRNVAAFEPEVGPPKLRRRSTAASAACSGAFLLTDAQRETFDDFFEADLADGALPFTWPDPRTGRMHSWIFTAAPDFVTEQPGTVKMSVQLLRLP
jgi:hypothetical protein